MDAGTVALSECDARESAAKVKVVSVGDAAGPAGLQSPCRLLMLAEMDLTGEGGVEDRGGRGADMRSLHEGYLVFHSENLRPAPELPQGPSTGWKPPV